mgnify:CR=1 FL=1
MSNSRERSTARGLGTDDMSTWNGLGFTAIHSGFLVFSKEPHSMICNIYQHSDMGLKFGDNGEPFESHDVSPVHVGTITIGPVPVMKDGTKVTKQWWLFEKNADVDVEHYGGHATPLKSFRPMNKVCHLIASEAMRCAGDEGVKLVSKKGRDYSEDRPTFVVSRFPIVSGEFGDGDATEESVLSIIEKEMAEANIFPTPDSESSATKEVAAIRDHQDLEKEERYANENGEEMAITAT